jgi:hypothetical protein
MNGLTAANVGDLVDAIKKTHADCLGLRKFEAAHALADVLFAINRLRQEIATQASRPDRVGDECWYGAWKAGKDSWTWRRGILRAWLSSDYFAIVEDAETKRISVYSQISFATEAPK